MNWQVGTPGVQPIARFARKQDAEMFLVMWKKENSYYTMELLVTDISEQVKKEVRLHNLAQGLGMGLANLMEAVKS